MNLYSPIENFQNLKENHENAENLDSFRNLQNLIENLENIKKNLKNYKVDLKKHRKFVTCKQVNAGKYFFSYIGTTKLHIERINKTTKQMWD